MAGVRRGTLLVAALALASTAIPLTSHVARAASVEETAARLEAAELEVAVLRKQMVTLKEQSQKQKAQQTVQPQALVVPRQAAFNNAYAADLPVKAMPPAPVFSWTGFYAGANVGLGVGRSPTTAPVQDPAAPAPFHLVSSEQANLSPFGAIGGVQIGYNYQVSPNWVFGVETDFQGSGQKDNRTCIDNCVETPLFGEALNQRIDWFGTVRGRVGWTNGPSLFYVTGGGAYGHATTDLVFTSNGAGVFEGRFGGVKTGWTAGAGIESQISGNWTLKAEYLYIDLGSVSGAVPTSFGETFTFSGHVHDHIGRVGVNYKFGDPVYASAAAAGMYTKAAPPVVVANWTGFYVGGNVGGLVGRSPSSESQTDPVFTIHGRDSFFLSPVGVIGGVQFGANWQVAPHWVVGLEDDFQASGARDSTTCLLSCSTEPPGFVSQSETIHQNIDWFGTARGRVGWTEGPWMLYGTGGLAYGRVTSQLTSFTSTGAQQAVGSSNISALKAGWTAGAGIEVKLIGNWSAKAEYLFVDLGTIQDSVTPTGALNPDPRTLSYSSDVRDHIFRLGVNYRFDNGPIVARY